MKGTSRFHDLQRPFDAGAKDQRKRVPMSEQPKVEFLDQDGNVLAVASLPNDLMIEGEIGSAKECDINTRVLRSGRATHYRTAFPNGEVLTGAVIQIPVGNTARDLMLPRVDLQQGEVIQVKWQVITTKDK
jgi:hypothetical protein